jgi:hypothetical protein
MMIERGDFTGVHEPFSHVEVFGDADISGTPLATGPEVIAELRSLATTRQVFIKDTTDRRHPEALGDRRFLAEDAQHTFLIRHPRETIRSYLAIRRNPGYTRSGSRHSTRCTRRSGGLPGVTLWWWTPAT